jgi:predicted DNA binding CopG/RHH family protein
MSSIKIRLKEADRAKIKEAATAMGLPVATFIRLAALKLAGQKDE